MKKYLPLVFVTLVGITIFATAAMNDGGETKSVARPILSVASTARPADHAATNSLSTRNTEAVAIEPIKTAPDIAPSNDVQVPAANVTLVVGSTTYAIYAPEGSTVIDVMRAAASTTAFRFSAREYPSLGMFIDSIDGVRNAHGAYWTLYINGSLSQLGASNVRVKSGDTVKWIYETL